LNQNVLTLFENKFRNNWINFLLKKNKNTMAIKTINPCLWMDGNGNEAAEFYLNAFSNGEITANNGLVVTFNLFGQSFMLLNGGPMFKINPSISFFVLCENIEEIDLYWTKLSDNGKVLMALDTYPWAEKYGWCQDKFGVSWQLIIGTMGDNSQKIVPSFMFSGTQNGKAETALNYYTAIFETSQIVEIDRYKNGEGDIEGNIKYSLFKINNQYFTAMESSSMHQFSFNEAVSLVISCDTQQEIDYFWEKLTANGTESQCGWLKDRFGVSWQVVPSILGELMSNPEKRQPIIDTFMKMKKFEIAPLLNV
jgi:predicted 3-demethylubiquinone-9 3-methyltransferase (glyoxalase superfamily)